MPNAISMTSEVMTMSAPMPMPNWLRLNSPKLLLRMANDQPLAPIRNPDTASPPAPTTSTVQSSTKQPTSANEYAQDQELGEDLVDTKAGGVDRLPVSIAELNIKPYKCLKCGFRSDRKSDTLRHIRIKHDLEPMQAYKFLKIMSIKDASETIEEYESTRTYRKSTSRPSLVATPNMANGAAWPLKIS